MSRLCEMCGVHYVGVDDMCWGCCKKEAYEEQYDFPLAMERIGSDLLAVISVKESVLLDDSIEREIQSILYWEGAHYRVLSKTTGEGKKSWYEETEIHSCYEDGTTYGTPLFSLPVFTCGHDNVLKFFRRWQEMREVVKPTIDV
jgi:hypothetical protein